MLLRRLSAYHFFLLGAVPLLAWLVLQVLGPSGLGRISVLEDEIAAERIKLETLQQRNQLMAAEIRKLKENDGRVELLARYHFGMIKPGEVFLQSPRH